MSPVRGWAALAAAAVALAGGAATAQAAPRARPRKPQPALAVGTSRDGSWRLEGRELTVRLRGWLDPGSSTRTLAIRARCGDGAIEDGEAANAAGGFPPLVVQGGRRARVPEAVRTLRVSLSRDVAARATWCGVEVARPDAAPRLVAAWMNRRRGAAPACQRTASERTVFETLGASVFLRTISDEEMDSSDGLRACLRPAGRSVGLAEDWAGGGGGGGGSRTNDSFAAGGRWLAWASEYHPSNQERDGSADVVLRDLAAPAGYAPVRFALPNSRGIYPDATVVAVTSGGTVVWIASTKADGDPASDARVASLHVGTPDGRTAELDRTSPRGNLFSVIVSADGRTVSWNDGGVRKSAPLPGGS